MIEHILINTYTTFAEFNDTTTAGLFLYPADVWAGFIPLTLFALFSIVLMSTFFSQKRLSGRGDFKASFAVAGFFTAVISLIMTMIDGLISIPTVVICVSVSIIGVIILLNGKDNRL